MLPWPARCAAAPAEAQSQRKWTSCVSGIARSVWAPRAQQPACTDIVPSGTDIVVSADGLADEGEQIETEHPVAVAIEDGPAAEEAPEIEPTECGQEGEQEIDQDPSNAEAADRTHEDETLAAEGAQSETRLEPGQYTVISESGLSIFIQASPNSTACGHLEQGTAVLVVEVASGAEAPEEHQEGSKERPEGAEHPEGLEAHKEDAEERQEGVEEHPKGVEERPEAAEERPEAAEERPEGAAERPEGAEERQEGAEERQEGAEERQEGTEERQEGTEERQEGTEDRLKGAEERQESAEERPESAEDRPQGEEECPKSNDGGTRTWILGRIEGSPDAGVPAGWILLEKHGIPFVRRASSLGEGQGDVAAPVEEGQGDSAAKPKVAPRAVRFASVASSSAAFAEEKKNVLADALDEALAHNIRFSSSTGTVKDDFSFTVEWAEEWQAVFDARVAELSQEGLTLDDFEAFDASGESMSPAAPLLQPLSQDAFPLKFVHKRMGLCKSVSSAPTGGALATRMAAMQRARSSAQFESDQLQKGIFSFMDGKVEEDGEHEGEQEEAPKPPAVGMKAPKVSPERLKGALIVLGSLLACLIPVAVWGCVDPVATEGAFAYITQIEEEVPVCAAQFEQARTQSVDAERIGGNSPGENGLVWRRLVIVYALQEGNVVGSRGLASIRRFEEQLRSLPGWQRLCHASGTSGHPGGPDDHAADTDGQPSTSTTITTTPVPGARTPRVLCEPGDSLASAIFATELPDASPAVLSEVIFDGRSPDSSALSVHTALDYFRQAAPEALERWLPRAGTGDERQALRSNFAFGLPAEAAGVQWTSFLEELEPVLASAIESGELAGGLRLFVRADGLENRDFADAFDLLPTALLIPISALVVTLLTTRRLLLSFATALLCFLAALFGSTVGAGESATSEEGRPAVPVVATAAWCVCSAACVDLAVACAGAWGQQRKESSEGITLWAEIWRDFGQPITHTFLPSLGNGLLLLFQASASARVPLVSEFCWHLGLGIICACCLAAVFFPAMITAGNMIAIWVSHQTTLKRSCMGKWFWECGGITSDQTRRARKKVAVRLAIALNNCLLCPCVVGIAIALTVVLGTGESSVDFVADTPPLFPVGHRLRETPRMWNLFAPLPSPVHIADVIQLRARRCRMDAGEKEQCSWHWCMTNNQQAAWKMPGECTVWSADLGLGCDSAAARFVGLDLPSSLSGDVFARRFWTWAKGALSEHLQGDVLPAPGLNRTAPLMLEDWSLGQVFFQSQSVSVASEPPVNSSLLWEEACLRIIAFCGDLRDVCSGEMTNMGVFDYRTIATSTTTTMTTSTETETDVNSTSFNALVTTTSPDNVFGGGIPHWAAGEGHTSEVFVFWGLQTWPSAPALLQDSKLEFTLDFVLEDPWAQRNLLSFCAGTHPDLSILSRRCFAIDFRQWLAARDVRYPVHAIAFKDWFMRFAADQGQDNAPYFWMKEDGDLGGTFATFTVPTPASGHEGQYMSQWSDYCSLRSGYTRGIGAPSIQSPLQPIDRSAVREVAQSLATLTAIWLALMTLVLTWSPGLACAAVVSFGVILLGLACLFLLFVQLSQAGALEIVGLVAFVSSLVTPVVRVAQQHACAVDVWKPLVLPEDDYDWPADDYWDPDGEQTECEPEAEMEYEPEAEMVSSSPRQGGDASRNSSGAWSMHTDDYTFDEEGGDHDRDTFKKFNPRSMSKVYNEDDEENAIFAAAIADAEKELETFAQRYTDHNEPGAFCQCFCNEMIVSERRARAEAALRKGTPPALSGAMTLVLAGATLAFATPMELVQVGIACFLAALAVPIATLFLLPMLALAGLAPTQVWNTEVAMFWVRRRLPGNEALVAH